MSKQITFAELEKLLLELGFVPNPAQGTQQVFVYPDLDVLVVFPGYNKKDTVHPAHLVSTRKILSENGLMDADVFNEICSSSKVSA
jgi:predicted RNA binding protein YcfA (HicA-like mRNA interferase family)